MSRQTKGNRAGTARARRLSEPDAWHRPLGQESCESCQHSRPRPSQRPDSLADIEGMPSA